ncbi:TetR/AcrR family transcriptional regulator [Roseivivax isoporae]|uniref:TetR family transcriptional regulator n=1 Tax=Roseivivax isoporae LMG 25204 TaxID=1449351 RepID=X7FBN7_9RHOB|nr:TetR/AcrR family transcriptional regulator [Roseivivax isoporae]ETX30128.1 TetR family transcriptional regulator [Roseivivax isoporae LMG 25204]
MARTRASDFETKRHGLLLDAARVFATQGMDKASMSQIAAAAGVSKSLLYHYYPSKDALIYAVIATHLEALDTALVRADDPDLPPRQRLRALVMTVLDAYRGADDQHKVQLNAGTALTDAQQAALTAIERRIVRRFADCIGTIRPALGADSRHLLMPVTMSLFGMLNWVYMWFRDDGPVSREDYADLATALILDGVGGVG